MLIHETPACHTEISPSVDAFHCVEEFPVGQLFTLESQWKAQCPRLILQRSMAKGRWWGSACSVEAGTFALKRSQNTDVERSLWICCDKRSLCAAALASG